MNWCQILKVKGEEAPSKNQLEVFLDLGLEPTVTVTLELHTQQACELTYVTKTTQKVFVTGQQETYF